MLIFLSRAHRSLCLCEVPRELCEANQAQGRSQKKHLLLWDEREAYCSYKFFNFSFSIYVFICEQTFTSITMSQALCSVLCITFRFKSLSGKQEKSPH